MNTIEAMARASKIGARLAKTSSGLLREFWFSVVEIFGGRSLACTGWPTRARSTTGTPSNEWMNLPSSLR